MVTTVACTHESSLVYFDKLSGTLQYWEVCDTCGAKFNEQIRKSDEECLADEQLDAWLKAYRVNLGEQDT